MRGYLTGDSPQADALLDCYEVVERLPLDRRRIQQWLDARGIGRVIIKKRGVDVDPMQLERQWAGHGDASITLLITRWGNATIAIAARRWRPSPLPPQHTDSALSEEQIGKIESSFVGSIADALKIKGGHGSRKSRVDDLWEGYETDPLLAAAEYAQRVSSSAAMRDTAKKMILTFTGRETTWDQYKEEINPNAKYSEYLEYTKRNMISPTEQPGLYQALEDYMEYVLTPSSKVDEAISKLQALALMKFIGLRVSSSAINLTNMYISVPPTIASHPGLGLIDSMKHINSAAGKYSLYRLDRVSESSVVPEGLRNEIQKMATERLTEKKSGLVLITSDAMEVL